MKTVTMKNSFNDDVSLNKDEFVERWSSHIKELHRLSLDHKEEFDTMVNRVTEIAGEVFEDIYEKQTALARKREQNNSSNLEP